MVLSETKIKQSSLIDVGGEVMRLLVDGCGAGADDDLRSRASKYCTASIVRDTKIGHEKDDYSD
jgi:hypothetical protein